MKALMTLSGVLALLYGSVLLLAVLGGPTLPDFRHAYWHRLAGDLLGRGTPVGLLLLVAGIALALWPVFPTAEESGWERRHAALYFGLLVGVGTVAMLVLVAGVVVMVPGDATRLLTIKLRTL
jgi:hypothetical protein